jgi:hypothetical protein
MKMTRSMILACALLSGSQLVAAAGAPARPLAGAPVDTCAMLPEAEIVAAIGKLTKPVQARAPNGSLLGSCEYHSARANVSITAHPSDELDGTVASDVKAGKAKAIAALGEKAFQTEYGVMFQPAGKPYFVAVYALSLEKFAYDAALSEALARKLSR